ncbi:MAG: DUF3822 family protein [Bacteroidota bacterium]|nr:DUF3822 family protein [Bacteroidota bacterium]MDP4225372.1 DUF3822 family protein [Bacteroidota bacterium]MDP4273943.1 DUF3822 family protein [Bacteroidota bacterium]
MQNISALDETLDVNASLSYHLSIQANPDGFSFCVLDLIRAKYIVLKHFNFSQGISQEEALNEIRHIFNAEELLGKKFKSVYFIMTTPRITLVPAALFNEENAAVCLSISHIVEKSDEVLYKRLKGMDAYAIFAMPSAWKQLILEKFPNAEFFQQSIPFIDNVFEKNKWIFRPKVYINFQSGFFDITVLNMNKLKLYNCFPFQNGNDVIYHLMNIYKRFNMNPEEVAVVLSGDISKNSPVFNLLTKYIRDIRFDKPGDQFIYSYTFKKFDPYIFLNLLNLYTCV